MSRYEYTHLATVRGHRGVPVRRVPGGCWVSRYEVGYGLWHSARSDVRDLVELAEPQVSS